MLLCSSFPPVWRSDRWSRLDLIGFYSEDRGQRSGLEVAVAGRHSVSESPHKDRSLCTSAHVFLC